MTALASGTVNNPTEAEFLAALDGGGRVTINCDGTIFLTRSITISQDTIIDATNHVLTITLNTNSTTFFRLFIVDISTGNGTFIINHLNLSRGRSPRGSAIDNVNSRVVLNYCTISENQTTFQINSGIASGGAIYNNGVLEINACTFVGNAVNGLSGSALGGAIYNIGRMNLTNCTFSGNVVNGSGSLIAGGAIYNSSGSTLTTPSATVVNCTFAGNDAIRGLNSPGVGGNIFATNASFTLKNSIVTAANVAGNIAGNVTDGGHNISSDGTAHFNAAGSLNGTDPKIGALSDNGGLTLTAPLLAGSPAVDAADDSSAPPTDQRGVIRPVGAHADIGAFEGTVAGGTTLPGFHLNSASYSVFNAASNLTVTVVRPVTNGIASVDFATADGTAFANLNYAPTNGTLVFAATETNKSFVIPILQDPSVSGDKDFSVALSNPTNGILATPSTAPITIIDLNASSNFQARVALSSNVTFSSDQTITLTNTIIVTKDTVIDGTGHSVIIRGSDTNAPRLFKINSGVSLTLTHVTLARGNSTNGGALFNDHGTLVLSNCTLTGNTAAGKSGRNGVNGTPNQRNGSNGTSGTSAVGGAIYNLGSLLVTNCSFLDNAALGGNGGNGGSGVGDVFFGGNGGNGGNGGQAWGGAIFNAGTAFVIDTTFDGNRAAGGIGGTNGTAGAARFPGRKGGGGAGGNGLGGAIYNFGTLTITNSTFSTNVVSGGLSGNAADQTPGLAGGNALGAAILNFRTLTAANSTFANNSATAGNGGDGGNGAFARNGGNGGTAGGGAIYSTNSATIFYCTLSGNTAKGGLAGKGGAGAFPGHDGAPGGSQGGNIARIRGRFVVADSILNNPTNFANAYGVIVDGGHNLSSDATCHFTATTSRNGKNPLLGALADNGGPTQTITLFQNSPAINAGDPANFPPLDQRGSPRPQGGLPDMGAFEAAPAFTISGRITLNQSGATNIAVNATATSSSAQSASALTSTNGFYAINGLLSGTYAVTPSHAGYTFDPVSVTVSIGTNLENSAGSGASNVNFTVTSTNAATQTSITRTADTPAPTLLDVTFAATPNQSYLLQGTTNLIAPDWITISTNTAPADGVIRFQENRTGEFHQRFFRIVPR